jgi:hypothetical protein
MGFGSFDSSDNKGLKTAFTELNLVKKGSTKTGHLNQPKLSQGSCLGPLANNLQFILRII